MHKKHRWAAASLVLVALVFLLGAWLLPVRISDYCMDRDGAEEVCPIDDFRTQVVFYAILVGGFGLAFGYDRLDKRLWPADYEDV